MRHQRNIIIIIIQLHFFIIHTYPQKTLLMTQLSDIFALVKQSEIMKILFSANCEHKTVKISIIDIQRRQLQRTLKNHISQQS